VDINISNFPLQGRNDMDMHQMTDIFYQIESLIANFCYTINSEILPDTYLCFQFLLSRFVKRSPDRAIAQHCQQNK